MTPYADLTYFAWLVYPALPTVALGWLGRAARYWIVIATIGMLALQYNKPTFPWLGMLYPTLAVLALFAAYQYAVTTLFLKARRRAKQPVVFYVTLALSLVPLVIVKLTPLTGAQSIIGFLGISYVSFRALDAIIVIQDGLVSTLPAVEYLAFLLFFPAISSGPIDRYRRFDRDWAHTRTREEFVSDVDKATHKLMMGLLYKFILAYLIKQYWLDPASHQLDLAGTVSYMYAYSFYLFFDFAGYSLFAIALSYLFGIHTVENFHRPFAAQNIVEFWNRWHMSLSYWFRDHIYARFVMAATRGKWFKSRYAASYLGFALTFGLMGLWHGVQWHYLVYGLYHTGLFISHDLFARFNKRHGIWKETRGWQLAGIVLTFQAVCFGFLIFSGRLG